MALTTPHVHQTDRLLEALDSFTNWAVGAFATILGWAIAIAIMVGIPVGIAHLIAWWVR